MINGKRILVVVPARGGSKGIPLKNLREVGGVPLIALVGRLISAMPEIDRAVVSTDHEKIASVAMAAGLAAPFRRPESLSGDRIGDWDVLTHALKEMESRDNTRYDIIVMLQPTSPLRTTSDVMRTIVQLIDGEWDAVWTVSETDSKSHPLKQLTIKDGEISYYDPAGANIIARQQLTPVYHRNGVAYAIKRECLLEQGTIMGAKTGSVIIEGTHVSIDTEWDIQLIEMMISGSSSINR